MDYAEVLARAKETIGPNCKVCPECNGLGCGNTMPGPGSKAPGNGAYDSWKAWKNIKLNMDAIAPNTAVDTSCQLFGRTFSMPLMTAPIGSLAHQFTPDSDVRVYNDCVFAACQETGTLATFADGLHISTLERGLEDGKKYGSMTMPIINPHANETIKGMLDLVNAAGTLAVGVVVDSAGLPHLKKLNANAGSKTVEDLAELAAYAEMPFVVKGIMTAKSAEKAVQAGAAAIIVSNHGGRALAETPATAEVLPEIVEAVKGRTTIIVDGGIRTGLDIFKALALGADAVMICRPFIISYYGGGKEGIVTYIEKLRAELIDTMFMCGARSIGEITRDMVRV